MNKIEELELRITKLESIINHVLFQRNEGWTKLTDAAIELGVCAQTLRRKIAEAKAFPKNSPYKHGVHWRGDKTYQIHVHRWSNVTSFQQEKLDKIS
jgi:hypothetical protein